jgi:predicted RNA-binding protein with TRAM domain
MSYGQNTRTTRGFSKPVKTGKEYMVDITDTGRGGDGIVRIGGFVIIVKHAKVYLIP